MSTSKFVVTRMPHPDLLPTPPGERPKELAPNEPVGEYDTEDGAIDGASKGLKKSNMPHFIEQNGRTLYKVTVGPGEKPLVERL